MESVLQRGLGLPETTAIAIGAMVGSGIVILPGIAYATAVTFVVHSCTTPVLSTYRVNLNTKCFDRVSMLDRGEYTGASEYL